MEVPRVITNNIIRTGLGHYAFVAKPDCATGGDHRIGLAHGLGHILGFLGHTPDGYDLMGSPRSIWSVSPLLEEVMNWLYSVPPGVRPV